MNRAFVTGASGFIGSHLVETLLSRGDDVACLVRRPDAAQSLAERGARVVVGDLSDGAAWRDSLAAADVVYHVAGVVSGHDARALHEVNCLGTHRLAEACAARDRPPAFVYVSSLAAAGTARRGLPRDESERPRPISHYGRSKRAGEMVLERFAAHLPATVVRPGIVLGPRNRDSLPLFTSVSRFGIHAVPTFKPPRISLIHIDDLIQIVLRAAAQGRRLPGAGAWNAGQGYYFACLPEQPTLRELGTLLAGACRPKWFLKLAVPEPFLWALGAANEVAARLSRKPQPLGIDKVREILAGSWQGSSERVRRELDYTPQKSLEETVRETACWYRENGWL